MENKIKKRSINTVIYLLLAAMLVCIVMVSVFTVASRRNIKVPAVTDTSADTQKDTAAQTDSPTTTDSTPVPESKKTDTSAVTEQPQTKPETSQKKTKDVEASAAVRYFVLPVAGTVSKSFEIDVPVYSMTMNDYRAHTGVDITAPLGCEVVSASSGTVCKIWDDPLMGKCVTVDHGDNIYTTYMNMAEELSPDIGVGVRVSMGQTIGAVGESAIIEIAEEPHLHLEMKAGGLFVDPLEYMGVSVPHTPVYQE